MPWLPGPGAASGTVFAPELSVTDGTDLDVEVAYVWGVDGDGDPYHNADGVTAGDEAVLVFYPATGEVALREVEVA